MDELQNALYDVESGITALCVYLADVAKHGATEVRNNLIEVLHKLASGEVTGTIFADFSKQGPHKVFVIANSEAERLKLLQSFQEEIEKQMPDTRKTERAPAIVIPFPTQAAAEESS